MAAKPKEKVEYHVTIVDRHETPVFVAPEQAVVMKVITYSYGDFPPRTIWIPLKEYSPEREKEEIRKDIEKLLKIKPETIVV